MKGYCPKCGTEIDETEYISEKSGCIHCFHSHTSDAMIHSAMIFKGED